MVQDNSLKNNIQLLSRMEKKVFEKACNTLMKAGWDPIIEYDNDWGWVILATQTEMETILRRIKPFGLDSVIDFDKALKIQARLRLQLVEVVPFKVFLGNKISISELDKPFKWLTEADSLIWTKFFRNKNFNLKTGSIDEANNFENDQLVGSNFMEAINGPEK